MNRKGGCACGAIRFETEAEPMVTVACHCDDCQILAGGRPNYVVLMPRNTFEVTPGTPLICQIKTDSGEIVERAFCGACGTHLWGVPARPPFMTVKLGAFHDRSGLGPTMHIYTAAAPAWHVASGSQRKLSAASPMMNA